ncbi:MAG: four helix bundle protein [Terriglobia bacterium]
MGKPESFEDLIVWQKSMKLLTTIYEVCQLDPISKDWGLRDQMQRAAVSIPANISEGYERDSKKELIHFLRIAKGSAGELRCLLRVACSLKFIRAETAENLIASISEISRMLRSMANSVSKSLSSPK